MACKTSRKEREKCRVRFAPSKTVITIITRCCLAYANYCCDERCREFIENYSTLRRRRRARLCCGGRSFKSKSYPCSSTGVCGYNFRARLIATAKRVARKTSHSRFIILLFPLDSRIIVRRVFCIIVVEPKSFRTRTLRRQRAISVWSSDVDIIA